MLDPIQRKEMLRTMIKVRAFEEKLTDLYQNKAMFGSTHSYRGQEAIAAGVCAALAPGDLIASYHRGTGHLVAKGADLYKLLCECMGRADGYSKGRGGKMHMGDLSFGFLGNTGTVGATVPFATGAALAAQIRGSGEIAISFMGDGAMNQGVVHESMNMAGLWKLPVIYVVENNLYAMTVSLEKSVAVKHLAERAAGYGFEGKTIDGNDADLVYEETSKAADKARRGGGPTLLECLTYRWDGHFGGDPGTAYRKREEIEQWKGRDPIRRLKEKLIAGNELTEADFDKMSKAAYAELEEVASKAVASPLPAAKAEVDDVFARE
ncbi:MAG TPA: thiamine pyrophosphate-dependent dehydrogenase E1 component subunit alpha [Verrucomicrobiae bacterium]|jgi:acetoin:2,6-dichlorophenolindophenol oxidoreductase subunit alpha|nr:thiamine pyrophosphate-dependent dehydrogenase E1 component subunit alpha [Verrucomicrobiae bacterium]